MKAQHYFNLVIMFLVQNTTALFLQPNLSYNKGDSNDE